MIPSRYIKSMTPLGVGLMVGMGQVLFGCGHWAKAFAQEGPVSGPENVDPATAPMSDIHGIKPLLAMGANGGWIWIALIAVLLAAAAVFGWWLWRRRRHPSAGPGAPVLPPPEVEAYTQLDALAAGETADLKLFYYRLSAILRRYVERRFHIPAAEMTTEELLPAVSRLGMDVNLVQHVKAFCLRSDPIKFAGAAADNRGVAQELALVRDVVHRTTQDTAMGVGEKPPADVSAKASAKDGQKRISDQHPGAGIQNSE